MINTSFVEWNGDGRSARPRYGTLLLDLLHDKRFHHVAELDVVELLEAQTALVAAGDLLDRVLEALERRERALVHHHAVAAESAKRMHVDMRMYRVIYDAIDEIEAAMKGMLAPKYRENVIGHAEVRQTYKVSSVGTVAGCYVTDGKIQRACEVRIVRDGIVVHEGMLASLQRFKDAVKEVASGYECGLSFEKFNDIKLGDVVEAYVMEEIEA